MRIKLNKLKEIYSKSENTKFFWDNFNTDNYLKIVEHKEMQSSISNIVAENEYFNMINKGVKCYLCEKLDGSGLKVVQFSKSFIESKLNTIYKIIK